MGEYSESIKGLFLLILAISGNYVAETFGCQTRRLLGENQAVKHTLAFLILFFSIDFVSASGKVAVSPFSSLATAGLIYALFVLFTRMDIPFTIVSFLILLGIYFTMSYSSYLSKIGARTPSQSLMGSIESALTVILVSTVLWGSVSYYLRQRKEHSKGWTMTKFLFGTVACGKK
jgi:hypothetical protein